MRKTYQRRRQVMEQAISDHGLTPAGEEDHGGSSFWMMAPEHVDTESLASRLQLRGVVIEPGRSFFDPGAAPTHFYRLAYSSIPSARIARGVELIAEEIGAYGSVVDA